MATRKKSAPVSTATSKATTAVSTRAVPASGRSGAQASKTPPKSKRRVWDYIRKNDLQDKAKRTT